LSENSNELKSNLGSTPKTLYWVMSFLDLGKDLKDAMIVGNAVWIMERPISKPLKLTAFGIGERLPLCGQSFANDLLVFQRQAFQQFNDMQGRRTHEGTFAEFGQVGKPPSR